MLDVRAVEKTFGATRALDGVSFFLDHGDAAVLTGPNGAGKTTLLRILATLERPTRGEVRIDGVDPDHEGARARRALGYAGHDASLYPELTVRENVAFVAQFHLPQSDVGARVDQSLADLDLLDVADRPAGDVSRGVQQRTALARALVHVPAVLLLDEPTASLDADASARLARHLADLKGRGTTIVIATHAPEWARPLAGRVLNLQDGRLAEPGEAAP